MCQVITFRLADSLPSDAVERLASEPLTRDGDAAHRKRIDGYLDAGHGACWLRRPEVAAIVLDSLRYFDGQHYDLIAWAIMPNHVHVLIRMREIGLSRIVRGWKSFTARQINKLLGLSGQLWQEDYWDRYIRDEKHLAAAIEYIHHNPVKARLVERMEAWAWSSVGVRGGAAGESRAP